MDIKKIKFNSKDKTLEVQYRDYNGNAFNDITSKFGMVVHSDFIDAIKALRYHFARLVDLRECDQLTCTDDVIEAYCNDAALSQIHVQSVTFASAGEDVAVCISGNKRFKDKYINLTSPITALNHDDYEYYWELEKCLEVLKEETRLYMEEEKWSVKQQSLFSELDAEFTDEDSNGIVANVDFDDKIDAITDSLNEPAKPRRGRKSKTEEQSLAS